MAIKVSTGIVSYPIYDENDNKVATLVFDKNDSQLIDKIVSLKENLRSISAKFEKNFESAIGDDEEIGSDQMIAAMKVYRSAANDVINEFEEIFGEGLFREIFAVNYKLNPEFCPTIDAIYSVFDELMPIVTEAIASSTKTAKYSPANKGSNTRLAILNGETNE